MALVRTPSSFDIENWRTRHGVYILRPTPLAAADGANAA